MFNLDKFFGETGGKKISQWSVIVLVLLSIFLFVQALEGFKKLPSIGKDVYPQSTINVSGDGEAYAMPDIATFDFSVTETAKTVKEAQSKVDVKINKALTVVRATGVDDKDIKTTGYNVYPKYEYTKSVCSADSSSSVNDISISYRSSTCTPSKQILTGYEATQSITVKVRDIEKAGDLVTNVGATDITNVSGIQFSVDDRDQYIAQAREQAIGKAKDKARMLAKQLGVHLGKIMSYNENGNYPVYDYAKAMGGSEMTVSSVAPRVAELPAGETKITSSVSITYEIK
jgi:uncharacterized protein